MGSATSRTSTPGIYRRGSRYVVMVRDANGRQVKRAAATLAEARTLKATINADVARGEYEADSRMPFDEYARRWLTTFAGRTPDGIRPRTMQNYRTIIETQAMPFFRSMPLGDIRLPDIRRFAEQVASRGVSANTVRLHVGPLRVLLATAVEDGLIRANPAAEYRNSYGRRTERSDRARALTDDELGRLLDEMPDEYQLLVRFLAESGLRIGEAIELRWSDVDLDQRRVRIERRYYSGTVDAPKSRNGIRAVPITGEMVSALREVRADRPGGDERGLVFTSPFGDRVDVHNFRRRVYKKAAERAGIPWANIHMLRHTCASRLFRAGWSAKHVQHMLGHHSPAFTLGTYVHLMPDELQALQLPAAP